MRRQSICAIIALILVSCSHDPGQADNNVKMPSGPKPEPIKKLLDQRFEPAHSVEAIDKNVLALLLSKFRDDQRLANPNDLFDATDVLTGKPRRRLILAGKSPDMWFIEYEHGGYAWNCRLVIFSYEGGEWRIIYSGTGMRSAESKDLNVLKTTVSENEFHEENITTGNY